MKTPRNSRDVHKPLTAYSHQIEISPAERLLAMSGQVGVRSDGSIPADPIEQLEVALGNLVANLAAAGMSVEAIVKLTI